VIRYVFDTGALIAAERRKLRATRFLDLVAQGSARILVPLPVVSEWWRSRTDTREAILGATELVASLEIAKAAGVVLAKIDGARSGITIDAIVMATAALREAIVVTSDPDDFSMLAAHFPGVAVVSV
jgi:predicted nucleic acid-binding protein